MRKQELSVSDILTLGCDYEIGENITVRQPTSGDIIRYGELAYYKMVGLLTCISSDCKADLFDIGIDWTTVSDFGMFGMVTRGLTVDDTSILLGDDIDLSQLTLCANDKGDMILKNDDGSIYIDDAVRKKLSDFLCLMHQIKKKPEFPVNDFAKEQLLIESREQKKADSGKTMMPTLISYISNAPGSKYDYTSCLDLKFSMFMDCVSRLQIISDATALRNACYSGMIDTSKIDKNDLDMFRDISVHHKERSIIQETTK